MDTLNKFSEFRDEREVIAIIGMEGRFPGANDIATFWQNIKNRKETISHFSDKQLQEAGVKKKLLKAPNYVKAKGIIDDIELFDAHFFDYSPHEAALTDPQHRLFLESCWSVLEKAGYCADKYNGQIGVFAGMEDSSYLTHNLLPNKDYGQDAYQNMIGTGAHFLTTKVSYKLGLTGPSFNVNTACSTSLVAIATACKQLLNYECDMALAGGISLFIPQVDGYVYQEGGILSPDGKCRAFDAKAKGTAGGGGVGVVVLKRFEDAIAAGDTIEALILGAAINNDGADKVGYTAPSVMGQAKCIAEAIATAGITPETINYIEAHGTGTNLGDPIEIEALTKVFRSQTKNKQFCAIGSVKTNIGHASCAAGVASLIKTVCALKAKHLPPSLNFETPNPNIDFINSPFYVNTKLQKWQMGSFPRRAGVSSFGIGGTNAHVVLEEAPREDKSGKSRPTQMLFLSAKTETALAKATDNLREFLRQKSKQKAFCANDFADVAYTLQLGRKNFNYRRIVVVNDINEAIERLSHPKLLQQFTYKYESTKQKRVVFMFPGQGVQYPNMGLGLYKTEPVFKKAIDECRDIVLEYIGIDYNKILFPPAGKEQAATEKLRQTEFTQPATFIIEYALAKLFLSWGIKPAAVMGHSSGEYVAAVIAGVFKLHDALVLIVNRGKLIGKVDTGSMLAVPLPEDELTPFLNENISVSAINSPTLCVVSGSHAAIAKFKQAIEEFYFGQKVHTIYLNTSHAFHSSMMRPILNSFAALAINMKINLPKIPFISTVTGKEASIELQNSEYWVNHIRETVRFSNAVTTLLQKKYDLFLEIGPGNTLAALVALQPDAKNVTTIASLPAAKQFTTVDKNSSPLTYSALAKLWLRGVNINWQSFYAKEKRNRIPLPTYPFERQRYWVEPSAKVAQDLSITTVAAKDIANIPIEKRNVTETLQDIFAEVLGMHNIGVNDSFFDLGGHSLLALQIIAKVENLLQTKISLSTIYQARTVTELAKVVAGTGKVNQPMPVVIPIQQEGDRTPLFFIHPIGGTVFCYMSLSKHLNNHRPFYAIQDPRIHDDKIDFANLEEMASLYIEQMKTVQSEGPYLLSGHSYGGTVAFEMARQLREQGEEVKFVGLLDSWAIFDEDLRDDELFAEFDNKHEAALLSQLPDDISISKEFWRDLYRSRLNLMYKYKPAKQADMQLTLFKSQTIDPMLSDFQHQHNYWNDYTNLAIDSHVIPGDHESILQEPNVQILAQKMNECLADID